ncbi:DEAD/DEAH box helicase [Enterococcus sp. 669A]|uniref:DEAD/DEAH box helicase n=1 Tax=Candidatus Enterococcus moelleringii TaxID=2815325 RepID=A0ABS3LF41_9ENTE|nr:DEAD/DEAH box helicase [Enterococcus sp. 669A]MBO1308255.1 DEAD/DEAH box helicase [Enterococcus sp. 669A]
MDNQQLTPFLQENWQAAGFTDPSLIQTEVFEPITAGKNLVGVAPTGSGKTLAYLLPLINQLQPKEANQLLILTSSQELAMQVVEVARTWLKGSEIKVTSLIGGANIKRQQDALKKKPEVIVGTPGRVMELMTSKKLKSHQFKTVVFDEVDQLIHGQNLQLIQRILKSLPQTIQRLYFSATADKVLTEIQQIDEDLVVVDVSHEDTSQGDVAHFYLETSERKKVDNLRRLLNIPAFWGLLFFNQLSDLGAAEEKLLFHKLPVASLASDQNKQLRKQAIEKLKKHQLVGLLTTDIASRGLDIDAMPFVVNVDFPKSEESYLHRAGRVGRMGNEGIVISFVTPPELAEAKKTAKKLGITIEPVYIFGGALTTEKPEVHPDPKSKKKKSKGKKRK